VEQLAHCNACIIHFLHVNISCCPTITKATIHFESGGFVPSNQLHLVVFTRNVVILCLDLFSCLAKGFTEPG